MEPRTERSEVRSLCHPRANGDPADTKRSEVSYPAFLKNLDSRVRGNDISPNSKSKI